MRESWQLLAHQAAGLVPDGLVEAQGDPADARRGERELGHVHARGACLLRDQDGLMRGDGRARVLARDIVLGAYEDHTANRTVS